ncbi:tetratricopeptide repeat-containing sulfotransferase family protein [Salaquimonas pukyongi]|uniref:tetratricopeptide repeat-containing sulfotransferase family protein n=1 Tax=Salaquimonas pukyongi TaxID=2712698 RepID=UPI00096BC253|nr:sulfotransferase [Salaquimonas pukyongi]
MLNVDPAKLSTPQRLQLMRQMEGVLKHDPKNAELWCNIGVLHAADERWEEAQKHYKKALSFRKNDPEILKRTVEAFSKPLELVQARKYARKLLDVAPRDPDAFMIYSDVLLKMGAADKSVDVLERALKFMPGHLTILNQLAESYKSAGKMALADETYERIMEIDPYDAEALYRRCNNHKFTREEAEALEPQLMTSLERQTLPNHKASVLYGAGKVFQDCGEYEKAFEFFQQANELRMAKNSSRAFSEIANARAGFTREFFSSRHGAGFGLETDRPVFILGLPRSGTTLTESICGAHSKITAGDEQSYMGGIAKPLGIQTADQALFVRRLEEITPAKSRELAEHYLEMTKIVAGSTPHFTDKMPHNFVRIGLIKLLFPNAKIIHCMRNPLDNAVSLYSNSMRPFHHQYKADLKTLGLYYIQYRNLMRHWHELFPGAIFDVYYEDLVVNTEFVARKMIGYLGLEWEDGVMEREGSQRSVKTLSAWQVRQPVYTSSSGRWRHYERQLQPLIDVIGDQVAEYDTSLKALAEESGE